MIEEVRNLLNEYTAWLGASNDLRQVGDWIQITTPYLDRHNDSLQIYARREKDYFLLADDNYTIDDLEISGCVLSSPKRQDLLNMTLNGFGVKRSSDGLFVKATIKDFPLKKHNLVQAMLAVNDLFFLAEPAVKSLFYEDVVAWLDSKEVRFTPQVKFTGVSGYDHMFDFVIPKSKSAPERLLRAINRPRRDSAEAFLHAWTDTQHTRPPDAKAYAILNDMGQEVSGGVSDAFFAYDIKPVLWSERENIVNDLAA